MRSMSAKRTLGITAWGEGQVRAALQPRMTHLQVEGVGAVPVPGGLLSLPGEGG